MDKDITIDISSNFVKLGLAVASLAYPAAGVASATIDTAIPVVKAIVNVKCVETDIVATQLKACISDVIGQLQQQGLNATQRQLLQKYAHPRYAWWHDHEIVERMCMPDIETMLRTWFDSEESQRELYLSLPEINSINKMFAELFQKALPNYPNLLAWLNYDNMERLTDKIDKWMIDINDRIYVLENPDNRISHILADNGLHNALWDASRKAYTISKHHGNRFSYDIIDRLLPHGTIPKLSAPIVGTTESGRSAPIVDLCKETTEHIAIIGNGGTGKTTSLRKLMDDTFSKETAYSSDIQIPFFIELNQCPTDIHGWYVDSLGKTNFLTRYVACLLENHTSLHEVRPDVLSGIEKEFQRIPDNGKPRYLLLLDGFNEVKIDEGHSIRSMLSNEILVMKGYANVRIITTSRETQGAYYAHDFRNIPVSGLSEDTIIDYLKSCGKSDHYLADVRRNKNLMECLCVPLYLYMFASSSEQKLLPETLGEILYFFFHRESSFYSLRKRVREIRSNPLTDAQTKLILDFILPYIGFTMENSDIFSVNSESMEQLISEALTHTRLLFSGSNSNPFCDFNYRRHDLLCALDSLAHSNGPDVQRIIICVYDYLGIIYRFHGMHRDHAQRIRYAFTHHSFRDYFSAMWSIQLLRMMPKISPGHFYPARPDTEVSYHDYLNSRYWSLDQISLISDILMEHRNKPILDPTTRNWYAPDPIDELQTVMTDALDYCRRLTVSTHYMLRNILSTILHGRKELTMLDMSELDLSQFPLNNIICSRKGRSRTEGTNFSHSIFSPKSFQPETHQDNIIEYLYRGGKCLTLDFSGLLKSWDVRSGKLEYELYSVSPSGISDDSPKGFMKLSRSGAYLGVKSQESTEAGMSIRLLLFNMSYPQQAPVHIIPEKPCRALSYLAFSDDEKSIVMVCDNKYLYIYDLTGALLASTILDNDFHDHNEIYLSNADSNAYILSNNYCLYDDFDEGDRVEEDDEIPCVICDIHRLDCNSMQTERIFTFLGAPSTYPAALFLPEYDGFLIYEYDEQQITYLDCGSLKTKAMFIGITKEHESEQPAAFHTDLKNNTLCYIMYPDCCYLVDVALERTGRNGILKTYRADAIQKKLYESGFDTELTFSVNVSPSQNTFLLIDNNDRTYEWNSETDIIRPKYNGLLYDTAFLAADPSRTKAYLVHADNGISQFGGRPLALQYHHCYQNQGYSVSFADSDFVHNRLALVLADMGHEKVLIINLETFEEVTVFSTWEKFETITDLCFHEDGTRLLITTQYKCAEIWLDPYHISTVAVSESNERFAYGSYCNRGIMITAIEADDSVTGSRCEYYERTGSSKDAVYLKTGYYLIPELTKELFPYFVYANGDFGKEGPHRKDGIQQYWLTGGFFLEKLPAFESIMAPTYYARKDDSFVLSSICFDRQEMIYVCHKHPLATSIGKERRWTFMYLDQRTNEAILAENQSRLAWTKDFSSMTYHDAERLFERKIGNNVEYSVWGHVIPWKESQMIGCFELTEIQLINQHTAEESEPVDYEPGYSLCGCDFDGIIADAETIERIKRCGG